MSINAIIRITLNEANKTQYSMVTMKTFAVQYNLDQKQQINVFNWARWWW